jgi:hypothetical protein
MKLNLILRLRLRLILIVIVIVIFIVIFIVLFIVIVSLDIRRVTSQLGNLPLNNDPKGTEETGPP